MLKRLLPTIHNFARSNPDKYLVVSRSQSAPPGFRGSTPSCGSSPTQGCTCDSTLKHRRSYFWGSHDGLSRYSFIRPNRTKAKRELHRSQPVLLMRKKKQLIRTALSVWNSSGRAQSKLTPSEIENKLPQRETQAHLHLEWLMLSFYWRPLGMLHQPAFDLRSHRLNFSTGVGHLCICRVGFETGAACPRYI